MKLMIAKIYVFSLVLMLFDLNFNDSAVTSDSIPVIRAVQYGIVHC